MRLPAYFMPASAIFQVVSNAPPLNTPPRENMVKLYQVQCSNESLSMWLLSLCNSIIRCLGTIILFCIYNMYCD